jgi:hypothetical protein
MFVFIITYIWTSKTFDLEKSNGRIKKLKILTVKFLMESKIKTLGRIKKKKMDVGWTGSLS